MDKLHNKVVFVTGGSRGIGFAIVKRLAERGAKVSFCARKENILREAEAQVKEITPDVYAFPADITDAQTIQQGVSEIGKNFGPIDILVNNAGIYIPGNVVDTALEQWEKQFAINLKGAFIVSKAVAPQMIERQSGRMIFISSTIALISPPGNSCYTATQWGFDGFVGCIAPELLERGIYVHTLRPGFTDTSIFDEIGKPDMDIDWLDSKEIADAVDYLCQLPDHVQVPELTCMTTFQRKEY